MENRFLPIRVDDPAKGQYQPEMKVQTSALSILYMALDRPFWCFIENRFRLFKVNASFFVDVRHEKWVFGVGGRLP